MKKTVYGSGMAPISLWLVSALMLMPLDAAGGPNANATAGQSVCISAAQFQVPTAGAQIINTIFAVINTILADVGETFYENIIGNPNFQAVVGAVIILYVAIYGAMIMFNLANYRTNEIVMRLLKIAVIYSVVADGWDFFSTYVGNLFMGGMNELIGIFTVAGQGGPSLIIQVGANTISISDPQLNPGVMNMLTSGGYNNEGILSMVFSPKMWVVLTSLPSYPGFGWFMAAALGWALFEFLMMVIGAIATYVKAVVGLTFLFGIAPIFFLFLLFQNTRQIFRGWLNQVVSFALQPVMLFAFLSFYITLITSAINNMIYAPGCTPDWCFTKFSSASGTPWDAQWWRANSYPDPTNPCTGGAATPGPATGALTPINSGDWLMQPTPGTGTTTGATAPPPIPFIDVLYFLLLSHLGKSFAEFIGQIAQDLSQGSGLPETNAANFVQQNFMGGKGPAQLAASGVSKVGSGLSNLFTRR